LNSKKNNLKVEGIREILLNIKAPKLNFSASSPERSPYKIHLASTAATLTFCIEKG